jgi:S-formylglutathione hydrolase FrmB
MRKSPLARSSQGRLITLEHTSKVLADNPLKDPATRKLHVWLPPSYRTANDLGSGKKTAAGSGLGKRFPVMFDLVGYTGSGLSHTNWKNFELNVPERVERMVHAGKMGDTIVVFPDCFTALGGNQYVNSSAMGNYADYLTQELVPFIDDELRTLATRDSRACFGKSSGGYGAMIHGMKYAKTWGAIANHSGDAYFDFVYMHDWPGALNELDRYALPRRMTGDINVKSREKNAAKGMDDGRVKRFLDSIWSRENLGGKEVHALMLIAMSATYDPNPKAPLGFHLPFNLETGERIETRWKQWLKHDPINLVTRYKANLKSLRGIFIDCGWRDQYNIHYGSRILSKRLADAGVKHSYQEFDDTHSGIDYRMEVSLPFLYKALKT